LILCLNIPEAAVAASGELLPATAMDWSKIAISLRRRGDVEGRQVLRQAIVYIVFERDGKYAVYRRGASGGEGRLHALYSIGIGGHVNEHDLQGASLSREALHAALLAAVHREVEEELGIDIDPAELDTKLEFAGWLKSSRVPVDLDHIGAVYVLHEGRFTIQSSGKVEDAIENLTMLTLDQITDLNLEAWSVIVVDYLRSAGTS
jgi:predicted NUDIX family phosphoesterase